MGPRVLTTSMKEAGSRMCTRQLGLAEKEDGAKDTGQACKAWSGQH